MPTESEQRLLDAVSDLWDDLAAFAWHRHSIQGRGVVVCWDDDLYAAAESVRRGEAAFPNVSYVPIAAVPPGDDYRAIMSDYEPARQILVLVAAEADESEELFLFEASGDRPAPEACFESRAADWAGLFEDDAFDDDPSDDPTGPDA
ncbi:MAG: hypothetical protein KDA25_08805 [Phycisphaerales bacterium]|nr:hypothetical protein [Phycisphaerales bacterium]